jgi:hypothetical protein
MISKVKSILKKHVIYIHNRVLFSHKEEWDYVICRKVDGTGDKLNKQVSERQSCMLSLLCEIQNLKKDMKQKGEDGEVSRRREGDKRGMGG